MSRPHATPIQVLKTKELSDPHKQPALCTSPGAPSATSSSLASLASTSDPFPILKSESLRVFNQARALYIRIKVVHQASAASASFAVPKTILVALDEFQARSEDLRSAAHRLIVSVEADERRQVRERDEPDAVVMLGTHGIQVTSDVVVPLDILILELQHLDSSLERLEWEWNRSDVSAYWYGPCAIPGFVHSCSDSEFICSGADSLFTSGGLASDATQRMSSLYPPSSQSSTLQRASRFPLSPRSPFEVRAGVSVKKRDHLVSPLTPIDMPAPFRLSARHPSRTSSLMRKDTLTPTSNLNPSTPQRRRQSARMSEKQGSYLPTLALREWEDDELDIGRTRDVVLGCIL
jgi:hypothetical protein